MTLVEQWMKQSEKERADQNALADYEREFARIFNRAMSGLLEPYGELLQEQGYF